MIRLAILDLYDNTPNQGMRCIQDIVEAFEDIEYSVFDVRGKDQVPGLEYDIYISTGGPGSPLEGDGVWDIRYARWLDAVWNWNKQPGAPKKYVFFICHSFQIAVNHFKLAKITKRRSRSFGTFPTHKTEDFEPLFKNLPDPFFIADFRNWQAIDPDWKRIDRMGAKVVAMEKIRPHVDLERAIMAIRFSEEIFGVQFHPEAEPKSMLWHFMDEKQRIQLIEEHGEEKYKRLIDDLRDRKKILLTHDTILPGFLKQAVAAVKKGSVAY